MLYCVKKYIQNVWYVSKLRGKTGRNHKKFTIFCAKKFRSK